MSDQGSHFRAVLLIFPSVFLGGGVTLSIATFLRGGTVELGRAGSLEIGLLVSVVVTLLVSIGYASVIESRWTVVQRLSNWRLAVVQIAVVLLTSGALLMGEQMVFGILILPPLCTYVLLSAIARKGKVNVSTTAAEKMVSDSAPF